MKPDGELILCTIIASAPEYGVAFLNTYGGTGTTKDRLIGFLPYTDATCGAMAQSHFPEGSTVVCMQSAADRNVAYILTAVNNIGADMTDTCNGRVFYNLSNWTTNSTTLFDSVINTVKQFAGNLFKNHANSVDKDVLPGDFDVVNNGGPASIHVGKYLVQMKGSPLAFIDVAAIEDKIRMVASSIEQHTTTTFSRVADGISVHDIAVDAAEAFGLPFGTAIDMDAWDETLADTVPLFRMQMTEGPLVDGRECITVGFPIDEDKHTAYMEPPVLSKDRTALSGERTIASAKGINSVKSPALQAVLQFGYNQNSPRTGKMLLDLLTPFTKTLPEDKEDNTSRSPDQEIMDAALNKVVDKLFTKDYLPILKQKMMEAGLLVSENPLSLRFKEHTETGPSDQPQYAPPKFLSLTDPVTGQTHLYFDSTSFISQEPDGSILLRDGYGSEIRMSQGNIYISPALDLQLRPGRDMWGLIPRHMALDTQGYAIINSNRSVYLRAVGDMQLAAAADENGHGKLTIECNDKTGSKDSGLILHSLGNAAFTGHDMYIGINRGNSTTENRTENTDRPGTIIIDAGHQGTIMEKSMRYQISSQIFTVVTDSGQFHSAITVSGNAIGLYAQVVNMPVQLKMAPVNGSQKIGVIEAGVEKQVSLDVFSDPGITLKETTIGHGQIRTSGIIMSLSNVVARGGAFVSLSYPIQDDTVRTFIPIDVPNIEVNYNLANNTGSAIVQKLNQTIYQDYYIGGNCFRFPDDDAYGVVQSMTVPGMCWQEMTRNLVSDIASVAWEEKPVIVQDTKGTKYTACYPGWAAWSSEAYISQAGYESKPLKDNYITNTKKESKNA